MVNKTVCRGHINWYLKDLEINKYGGNVCVAIYVDPSFHFNQIPDTSVVYDKEAGRLIFSTNIGANVKLIDFGLSDSDAFAVHKESAGTRSYASPELLSGGEIDIRSDIYSLGLIMREVGGPYRRVASKCTGRDPSERYSSPRRLKRAIDKTSSGRLAFAIIVAVAICAASIVWICTRPPRPPRPAEDIGNIFEEISESIENVSGF